MTGFGTAVSPGEIELTVDFRGVNGRFLDPAFRLPDELRAVEPDLRQLLRANIQRGKVECRVQWRLDTNRAQTQPDEAVLHRLRDQINGLKAVFPDLAPPSATELLSAAGLFHRSLDLDELKPRILSAAAQAMQAFVRARTEEGNRIRDMLSVRLDAIGEIAASLRERVPEMTKHYEARLTERLQSALDNLPETVAVPPEETLARVRQEVTAYGLRADVSEELDRLGSHVTQCRTLLQGHGPVGKRLDFLMQELNREANTLGSKASAIDLTQAAVDLKVLIEQIREQVQNLE
jgi:uncharacterized protein (TIGR00255 family)